MRLAKHALLIALVTLAMVFAVSAQPTLRAPDDARNIAPTVGTGGNTGGPTGLFTIYDGQTLRRGEYTFSIAYSNFDRDPGNVDITEIPISFQIGLSDRLELFFNTDAYKGIKVNNPENLSGFYLPNSQLTVGLPAAIVLAPGTAGAFSNTAVFRPTGMPFAQYPYSGGSTGSYGMVIPVTSPLAFGAGGNLLGPPRAGGSADLFPGVGSPYGGILPGIVLQTATLNTANCTTPGVFCGQVPTVYSVAPSYLPDAPFINRRYGTSAFNTYNIGAKWRFNSVEKAWGLGVVFNYRWNQDTADTVAGFNQLQRGASAGGGGFTRGDVSATLFYDARVAKWANFSANVGYTYNREVRGEFPNGTFTLLDRPNEINYGFGLDFPVNQFFQPILEFRQTLYVGGRTPNALENNPQDAIAGLRVFPKRWFGFSFAYRYHINSQNDSDDFTFNGSIIPRALGGATVAAVTPGNFASVFRPSSDPHGFIFQTFIGRRNLRANPDVEVQPSDVTGVEFDRTEVVLPCPPGFRSQSGACPDNQSVSVRTSATNPDNATLTYNYTVSAGRIVGQGANVNWDLSGVKSGTYTITAASDNGCGFCGKTETKTIVVRDCPDCVEICNCPSTINVTGPSSITAIGDSMTFTANVVGGDQANVTYNWSVSAGTITSGQGTSAITVATNRDLAGATITATVEARGFCAECPPSLTGSSSGEVGLPPPITEPRLIDNIGKMADDDVMKRLEALRNELNADPQARGFIINTGSAREKTNRVRQINKSIRFLGIDGSRITVVDGGGSGAVNSTVYVVPAGADNPSY